MIKNQLISVIIPVYNGEKYLAEAIESVLSQECHPYEIIIVDDGSTDSTSAIAAKYDSVKYICQPHSGLPATLNSGVAAARGDFFAFLDADDVWVKDKLTYQMAVFRQDPNLDMVFGYAQEFLSPEISDLEAEKVQVKPGKNPGYLKGALLIKKTSFLRVGLFDDTWVVGDFIEWYKRALEIYLSSMMLPNVVLKRRVHTNNLSIRESDAQKDYVRILKVALDRQRLNKAGKNTKIINTENCQETQ